MAKGTEEGPRPGGRYTFHILSDATGSLGMHTLTAVLTQFPELDPELKCHTFLRRREDVRKALKGIRGERTLVFYAFVEEENREELKKTCARRDLPCFDLTASLVGFLKAQTGESPIFQVARLHQVNPDYLRRMEAMAFTAEHDDGRRIESIGDADIVLVGLSRVNKTPTSTYLGSMGYKTANVPVDEIKGFPKQLDAAKKKVVGFTIQPKKLFERRRARFREHKARIEEQGLENLQYYDLKSVIHEVMFAEDEYSKRKYKVLDVTGMTVEEIAARTLGLLKIKHGGRSFA